MAASTSQSRWYFTREQLESSPSRRSGMDTDKELSNRQQAANLVQEMGQRLNVSQLTINTAIVYMHRFYMQHAFSKFHRNVISPAALFLAAKVEEQPRKLEHVIKVVHACLSPQEPQLDVKSEGYLQQAQDLVILESIILQTLGFEITIEHPHTDVVKCTQLVRASKDLAQTSYFMATNSLHLTTFCLQYKPTVIACVCIHLACKWSNWEIPVSTDGKHWWEYVDPTVTLELLDELTHEFLQILEKTPSRLKRIRNWRANQAAKKPKIDGQAVDNVLPGSSGAHDSTLASVGGDGASSSNFSKQSNSTTTALPASLNSGSITISAHQVPDLMSTASFSSTSQQEWPQHQNMVEQAHSHKEMAGSANKNDMICIQQSASGQLTHHRPEKSSGHSFSKHEHLNKSGNGRHQGFPMPSGPVPQKLALDRYREKFAVELAVQKRKLETLDADVKEQYACAAQALVEQQKKRVPVQQQTQNNSNTVTSPVKMKIPISSSEKSERHAADKKDKGLLKLRIPIPPTEKLTKDDLKMKIKVPTSEIHSSSDEGSGKSKHTSPHAGKEHKEKRKEHSSHHHHHSSGHKHSHSHSSSTGNSRHNTDGSKGGTLRSPMGLSGDGSSTGSSSSRKRVHASDTSHNHHPKMSKTSKTAGGLWTTQHPHETG